ncbi:hypothetical protein D3C84_577830 [compost metagenome]
MKNCILLVFTFLLFSCSESSSIPKDTEEEVITPPENFPYTFGKEPVGGKQVYISIGLKDNDFDSKNSRWCYRRIVL